MEEDFDTEVAVSDAPEIKLFGKWTTSDVQINDISLTVSVSACIYNYFTVVCLFFFFFFSNALQLLAIRL